MAENMTLLIVLGLCLVLGISCILFLISKKFNLIPYTVLLALAGMIFSFFQINVLDAIRLNPESVFLIFLPILLFESAFNFDIREFRRIIAPGFLLASIGLIISTLIIAFPLAYFFNIPFAYAFLFGSVISSTDPIAVLTLFKQLGLPKKLQLLVDGESFLNDGTSVILFRITLGFLTGAVGTFGLNEVSSSLFSFIYVFFGGLLVGLVVGYIFSEIIHYIKNVNAVEITLTIIAAHLVFILCEEVLQVSGIIGVLATGIILGNYGKTKISPEVIHNMHKIWDLLVFIATSIIFFLIGYEIRPLELLQNWQIIIASIGFLLVARSVSVYAILFPYNLFVNAKQKIPATWMHIVNWGGLRGALPLIVMFSLPFTFEYRDIFIQLVIGAVVFTLLINAVTITPLIKLLGLDKTSQSNDIELKITEFFVLRNLSKKLSKLSEIHEIGDEILQRNLKSIDSKLEENKNTINNWLETKPQEYKIEMDKVLRRYCLQVEKSSYLSSFKKGLIPEIVYEVLNNMATLQCERLNEGSSQIPHIYNLDKKRELFVPKLGASSFKFNIYERIIIKLNPDSRLAWKLIGQNYAYHKARMLGNEAVIEELQEFMEIEFLPQNIVKGVKLLYNELLAHNMLTINKLEKDHPRTTKEVQSAFANKEIDFFINEILEEFGEEERISSKALQEFSLKV